MLRLNYSYIDINYLLVFVSTATRLDENLRHFEITIILLKAFRQT